MFGTGVVVSLWLLQRILPSRSLHVGVQDSAPADASARAGRGIIAWLAPGLAALFCWLSLLGWLGLTGPAVIWIPAVALMAYMTFIGFSGDVFGGGHPTTPVDFSREHPDAL
ncbi:hypothetical protein [Pseudarthrobacter sp. Y6]|uniref:hypothetical protein n=1 Tax=Pseudarthrobacter sp. Y6 TaxID=3418422 RepID=UPI003CF542C4